MEAAFKTQFKCISLEHKLSIGTDYRGNYRGTISASIIFLLKSIRQLIHEELEKNTTVEVPTS